MDTPAPPNRSCRAISHLAGVLLLVAMIGCRSAPPAPDPPRAVERADRAWSQAIGLTEQGNWNAAAVEWRNAANQASLLNDRPREATALHNLAHAERQLGQAASARSNAMAAAELNQRIGRKNDWWRNQILLMQVEAIQTNSTRPQRMQELLPRADEIADPSTRGAFWNEIGLSHLHAGDLNEASDSLLRAQSEYQRAGDDSGMATAIANRARVMEAQGQHALAARAWSDALLRFERSGDPVGIAHALLGHGRSLLTQDAASPAARDLVQRAGRNFRLLGLETEAARAEELLHKTHPPPR